MSDNQNLIYIKDLPSPKGHPILGHLPQFNAEHKHQVLERWAQECGDIFKINFVGKPFIVSADSNLNQEILKLRPLQFRRFSKINEILEEMGISGVFGAEGSTWKRQRKPTSESLNLRKVRSYFPVIQEKTMALVNKWEQFEKTNHTFDVQKEFMKYTIDITTQVAFGYQLDTINDKADDFQNHLELIFPMINERITAPIPTWRYIKRKKDKQLSAALKAIEKVIYDCIAEAKVRLEQNPDLKNRPSNFLESLLVQQADEDQFSDKEIYGNVFTMLLAGEDTTSNSISWAMYYLAQRPELIKKVRIEAEKIYGDHQVPQTNKELEYLRIANAIAQETIRLKPVSPNLYMQANEDIVVQNLYIPKDATIMMQNKVAQTSTAYFSNPEEFVPERWLINGCPAHDKHSPDIIKTFGGGARFCPGKTMAINEMIVAISSICKSFDFDLAVPADSVTEEFSFTMHPKNLLIRLKKVV